MRWRWCADRWRIQIVDDGEGVGHVVTLHVTGARTEAEAKQVAKAIAHSPLCKTAWSSGDPNWGRLLAAAGYSGVAFDPAQVTITIGGQPVFELGVRAPAFDEASGACGDAGAGVHDPSGSWAG